MGSAPLQSPSASSSWLMLKRREDEAVICRKHRATSAWRPWAKSRLLTPYTFFPCLGSGLLKARILFHQEIKQGSFCYGVSQRHWPVLIHPSIHPFMYPPIHLPMYLSILMHISLIQRAFIEYLLCTRYHTGRHKKKWNVPWSLALSLLGKRKHTSDAMY